MQEKQRKIVKHKEYTTPYQRIIKWCVSMYIFILAYKLLMLYGNLPATIAPIVAVIVAGLSAGLVAIKANNLLRVDFLRTLLIICICSICLSIIIAECIPRYIEVFQTWTCKCAMGIIAIMACWSIYILQKYRR